MAAHQPAVVESPAIDPRDEWRDFMSDLEAAAESCLDEWKWPKTSAESRARLHARILSVVERWPDTARMDWSEMAATLEFDQGRDRPTAEQLAFWRIKKDRGI